MTKRHLLSALITLNFLATPLQAEPSLLDKRKDHQTKLIEKKKEDEFPPKPPAEIFELIKYPSQKGDLSAYLSKDDSKSKPGPAIIWLTGGFPVSNSGASLWEDTSTGNEQSARIYRIKGINMMFPHLRGRSGNPGFIENFYGEVDDVISAFQFLSKQKHIDPKRIYLGGHSTGGTLALLVAAATDKFAGIISFGPVDTNYGEEDAVYQWNKTEQDLRAPILHLNSIKTPTLVIEGENGNIGSLMKLKKANKNPLVRITSVDRASHFSIIHPLNLLIADAIVASDNGKIDMPLSTIKSSYTEFRRGQREATDLRNLADLRADRIAITKPQTVTFYAYTDEKMSATGRNKFKEEGFSHTQSEEIKQKGGTSYFLHKFTQRITPSDLDRLWKSSAKAEAICDAQKIEYGSWSIESR